MRILLFVILFFSPFASAETVQIQAGFNLFTCTTQNGDTSCVSPAIKYETINLTFTDRKAFFEKTYVRDKFVFEYSIQASEYFNSSTNKKNYLLYLNLLSYVKENKDNAILSSANISIVNFKSLNEIEVDGPVVAADNIRALPFFGVAPLNNVISIKKTEIKDIKKENRLKKILWTAPSLRLKTHRLEAIANSSSYFSNKFICLLFDHLKLL